MGLTIDYLLSLPEKPAVHYCGLETLEIPKDLWQALSYPHTLSHPALPAYYAQMHEAAWGEVISILPNFTFQKELQSVATYQATTLFDVVYFDAFAPTRQAEMWQPAIFERLYHMMSAESALVTYCAKGQVRRDLQSVGFRVERLAGPAGKREMLRALK